MGEIVRSKYIIYKDEYGVRREIVGGKLSTRANDIYGNEVFNGDTIEDVSGKRYVVEFNVMRGHFNIDTHFIRYHKLVKEDADG